MALMKTGAAVPAALACAAVLALLCQGCLGPSSVAPVGHFLLAPELGGVGRAAESIPATLGIRPLLAGNSFDKRVAVLRPGSRLEYYPDETWSESPELAVTRAVTDAIVATGRFHDVGNAADMSRPDAIMTGELRAFFVDITGDAPVVRVEARLEMRQSREKKLVWAETLCETEPLGGSGREIYGMAMNRAVGRLALRVAVSVKNLDVVCGEISADSAKEPK